MESAPIKTLMKLGEVINKSDITRPINSFLKYIFDTAYDWSVSK